jgi:hypothetical protein
MASKVKDVADGGGAHAEKTLGGARRFELLHFVLSSHHLIRIFGSARAPAHASRSVADAGTMILRISIMISSP